MTELIEDSGVRLDPLDQEREHPPLFALLGAHGGSGVSTLTAMWAPAGDAKRQWPASRATSQRVIVVAREHMAGLKAAATLLRQADAGNVPAGVQIHGLITVAAKPGKASRSIVRYATTISELAPNWWRIGWLPALLEAVPSDLPVWTPGDPVRVGRRTADGDMATVPGVIADVGHEIITYFAGIRPANRY